jgi:hypothetical protein
MTLQAKKYNYSGENGSIWTVSGHYPATDDSQPFFNEMTKKQAPNQACFFVISIKNEDV